jgi:hypothetical protein
MVNWNEVEARLRRADDLRHEAEVQHQWPRSAGRLQPDRFFWRWEETLGNRLIALGCRLQTHVAAMRRLAQPPAPALMQHQRPCQNG